MDQMIAPRVVDPAVVADRERIASAMKREREMYRLTMRFATDPELIVLRMQALDRYIALVLSDAVSLADDES